ncbi:DUF167 domain-containing protein [candidate division WWE3 bacterium]|nr:DUF167 domain-containing protein [candidate division WWE3 bacterium]
MKTITVIAHPCSKQPRIEVDLLENYHVYIGEPPVNNQSNEAIILSLSTYFNVAKSAITIKHGKSAKLKIIQIEDC